MDLFARLRHLALIQAETIVLAWSERQVSSRRLWSRIERASARLQAQWRVAPGERVAYYGGAHPDALVFYLAAARSGACLVPLERPALQEEASLIARRLGIRLMLCEDGALPPADIGCALVKPLSELIMQPCLEEPSFVTPDPAGPSLEIIESLEGTALRSRRACLADILAPLPQAAPVVVEGHLFDDSIFGPVVLTALWAGAALTFPAAAADPGRKAGGFAVK
jgi:hypothetical protein